MRLGALSSLTFLLLTGCGSEDRTPIPQEMRDAMIEMAASDLPDDVLQYDDESRALPPWSAYPEIPRYSIGWRMGGGEAYWVEFWDWYHTLSSEEQSAYRAEYPEPEDWDGYYELLNSDR